MKAKRHDMYMSMLGLKHLEQVRDEKQKSTYNTRHEQLERTQDTTREIQQYVRHVRHESTYGTKHERHVKH